MLRLSILVVIAVLIIAVLVIMMVPLMGVTYYEEGPFIVSEDYLRAERYTEEVPGDYEVTDMKAVKSWWRPAADCSVTIKNTGNVSGYFRIEFNIITLYGDPVTKAVWQYLETGEQKNVVVRQLGDHVRTSFTCSVTPPTMVVSRTRYVPDTRETVEYREVEKTEKVTVFEYLKDW